MKFYRAVKIWSDENVILRMSMIADDMGAWGKGGSKIVCQYELKNIIPIVGERCVARPEEKYIEANFLQSCNFY